MFNKCLKKWTTFNVKLIEDYLSIIYKYQVLKFSGLCRPQTSKHIVHNLSV